MCGLGRESQVTAHRDTGSDHALDRGCYIGTALYFYGSHFAFRHHHPSGIAQRLLRRDLIGHEGHITDQHCLLRPFRDQLPLRYSHSRRT